MKRIVYLSQALSDSQVTQTLLDAQLLGKVEVKTHRAVFPQKLAQLPLLSNFQMRTGSWTIDRMEDNTLQCREKGRKLPLTPKGKIDKAGLELEFLLGLWELTDKNPPL
ncbi:MAG: hypothetical protein CVU03_03430 [Bacteroidetes bacterium HGW-Bacteroidetes-2]|jgi:hypothetical protein|nr:MAG: hypothetical protein CVU03_03430 [Bacteroidetes bacterium HGW-Bacteroidetes-2]